VKGGLVHRAARGRDGATITARSSLTGGSCAAIA
jgi:hypothetical protein